MRRDVHLRRKGHLSEEQIANSAADVESRRRLASGLETRLTQGLPVTDARDELNRVITQSQVVVVAGETGSGKTTQLPKLLLAAGLGVRGMIGHTQPRRLAARTVANRIAEEVGCELGGGVGFAVRFNDAVSDQTLIKVMTDGILLNEIRSDRFLDAYDAIIVDEAHERSLNIDFLLGYLRRLINRRRDLKVIVTSATIDVERISKFFDGAPVVEVGGRAHPVEVCYSDEPQDLTEGVMQALEEIETRSFQGARDVLIFCSGEREIFELARDLRRQHGQRYEVLPLYARLSFAEQRRIFQPSQARRRIVLATNVAETSITVPNIGFVIDPGFARINRYSYRTKLQRLPIEPIAKASADQRKGRCGRVAPGVCFRLYDAQDFEGRPDFTDPEIRRVNLAGVVLQMLAFNLGAIQTFPFVDPPDPKAIKDALRLLDELQALKGGKLTRIGRQMARLPIDPRLARMLVEANQQGSLTEMLIIISGLAVQDPRERPAEKAQAADLSHAAFHDPRSDFLSLFNLWRWLEDEKSNLTNNQYKRLLQKRFVNFLRVREWREVHRQLRTVARDLGWRVNDAAASYGSIHEAVVSGSLSLVAQHDEKGVFQGARNLKFRIFPGSGLFGATPKWIVAGEIAETSRVYGRSVAKIEPGWIERHAQHLLKKRYSEPLWHPKRGEVIAKVTLSLYGLVLADGRMESYDKIDRDLCRTLFIRDGLMAGALSPMPEFLKHNLDQVRQVQDQEAKERRRDLLVSEDSVFAFYDENLPQGLCRAEDLRRWVKRPEKANNLFLTPGVLLQQASALDSRTLFPTRLRAGQLKLQLKYRFAPGEVDDGITVVVPVGVLSEVGRELLEWSVPGFFPNVVEAWLRTLPKAKRKSLAPMPEKVDEIADFLLHPDRYRAGRLLSQLQQVLRDWYRLSVSESDWDRERVSDHLKLFVSVVDGKGRRLRGSRDLSLLKTQAQEAAEGASFEAENAFKQTALTEFPDLKLEDSQVLGRGANQVIRYPGFVDRGDCIELSLFDKRAERDEVHRAGLVRLALMHLGKVGRYFRKELDKHPKIGLHFATLGSAENLKEEILKNVVWRCYFEGRPLPEAPDAFKASLEEHRADLAVTFSTTVEALATILELRFECLKFIGELESKAYDPSKADILAQLSGLVPAEVLRVTPTRYLPLLPRYLKGIARRVENLPGHVVKDQKQMGIMKPLLERLSRLKDQELYDAEIATDLRFLAEEVRLNLFAETVARQKVSGHPLIMPFGKQWKGSAKRLGMALENEERRLGLR